MTAFPALEAAEVLADSRRRLPEWVAMLAEIVDQESGPTDSDGVRAVYDSLMRRLSPLGFEAKHIPTEGPDVLIADRQGRHSGRRRVLLIGHADTVFAHGTVAERPFRTEGGMAFGPGVADMKGGLVTAVAGLMLAGPEVLDRLDVRILVNGDEESGSLHSRPVVERFAEGMDATLVFEPGRPDNGVVVSRRGAHRFSVEVAGRAAHTGVNPQDGANAIEEAAHHILAIQELGRSIPNATVNAVMIHGGTRPNIVPDSATIRVDSRFDDAPTEALVVAGIRQLAERSTVPGTSTTVRSLDQRPAFERLDGGWFQRIEAAAVSIGVAVEPEATGGSSDGNFTAAMGIPTIDGLGAIGANYHTVDEYIVVDSLATRSALLAMALDGFTGETEA